MWYCLFAEAWLKLGFGNIARPLLAVPRLVRGKHAKSQQAGNQNTEKLHCDVDLHRTLIAFRPQQAPRPPGPSPHTLECQDCTCPPYLDSRTVHRGSDDQ